MKIPTFLRKLSDCSIWLIVSTVIFFSACQKDSPASGGGGPAGRDPSELSKNPQTCREFIAELKKDPTFYYGWVESPENYENPSAGRMLKIFYYGRKGSMANPIVFFNGGPGSSVQWSHELFENSMKEVSMDASRFDFIYIDQRGNGCSTKFPELPREGTAGLEVFRFYGSQGIVYDAEAVRRHLIGERKWKVFGQSYGGQIVHRYVTLFPESISKAYSHANVISVSSLERLASRIYSQHRVLELYLQLFPNDREKLKSLVNQLSNPDLCIKLSQEYCGLEMLEWAFYALGFSNRWGRLNLYLNSVVVPNQKTVDPNDTMIDMQKLKDVVENFDEPPESKSYNFAMRMIGYYDRGVLPGDEKNCRQAYAEIESRYKMNSSNILISECSAALQHGYDATSSEELVKRLVPVPDVLKYEKFSQGLSRLNQTNGEKSFFLYSGERDSFVPKETFKEQVSRLGYEMNYTHFWNSGHEGFRSEQQVYLDLLK